MFHCQSCDIWNPVNKTVALVGLELCVHADAHAQGEREERASLAFFTKRYLRVSH